MGAPRGRRIVHFLHISKTGGTAICTALEPQFTAGPYIIQTHTHDTTLRDVRKGDGVIFFVRDPISRFVSGFCSRQRQGQPRFFRPWSPAEAAAFARFHTPNALARAISSEDSQQRAAARQAMQRIRHVRQSYWDWFEDSAYFTSRLADLFFIGFQETLASDVERLRHNLKLPAELVLPTDDVLAHRSPRTIDTTLDEQAVRNLREWYARDYDFYELCRRHAPSVNEHAAESSCG